MGNIILRHYRPDDRDAFRSLNEAWIAEHFAIEEKDREVLGDPERHILAKGGCVVIAEVEGRTAGTCALLKIEDGFEIGKMTVLPELRGNGIGRRILLHTVELARKLGARRLFLETNNKLPDAIHLYESAGFRHIPKEHAPASPYQRSNVAMEMRLDP